MFQLAVYGKGGIGKSTLSANISYLLSDRGYKVLQIGCDPKHDSTRLLLNGRTQNTVLSYLRSTPREERELSDVLSVGSGGVHCIEAGGPEPGVGCAGRGILSMFDFLEANRIDEGGYDVKIYDILGDVVCGGFAVPIRNKYADAIYIVTSGEFMSLYAANNILKGIKNYDDGTPRVAGLILNRRGMDGEYEYVKNFADAVRLPIISVIERNPLFPEAEAEGRTSSEMFPDSDVTSSIRAIAEHIAAVMDGTVGLTHPHPLDEDHMDMVAKGIPLGDDDQREYVRIRNAVNDGRSLKSCAGGGAVSYLSRIGGTHTIIHGPISCAYMMCCGKDLPTLRRDLHGTMESIWSRVSCTALDESSSVYGGMGRLEEEIERVASGGCPVIFVVSMCVPGIIGDDMDECCRAMSERHGIRVIPVQVDGIGAGGVTHGRLWALDAITPLVEPCEDRDPGLINIMGEYRANGMSLVRFDRSLEELISLAGFRVNTIYPGKCDLDDIKRMGRAAFAVRASDGRTFREYSDLLCQRIGVRQMANPLPRGMGEIRRWLDEVAELTGRDTSHAKEVLEGRYRDGIAGPRSRTEGRRIIAVVRPSDSYGWFFELMEDLGVEVLETIKSTHNRWIMGEELSNSNEIYDPGRTLEAHRRLGPDLILSDVQTDLHLPVRWGTIGSPHPGLEGILDYAERFSRMFSSPLTEEWR